MLRWSEYPVAGQGYYLQPFAEERRPAHGPPELSIMPIYAPIAAILLRFTLITLANTCLIRYAYANNRNR
jgi:hypothetical protein